MNIFDKTINRIINAAGEWNAQLFRELKGRLNPKNFTLTLLGSFIAQALMIMIFFAKLPVDSKEGLSNFAQDYCFNINADCKLDNLGHVITNWLHWWTDILVTISWVLSTILVVGGLYLLASDLGREETRGTLNFVRLSPQSATNIFIGKLIGVPILIYTAVASILPLQLVAGFNSFGVVNTLVFDGLWLVIAGLFYLGAMLLMTITPVVPIGLTLFAWWLQSSVGMAMQFAISSSNNNLANSSHDNTLTWFYAPVFSSITNTMLFAILSCGLIGYVVWQMLCRRYVNHNDTLIAKKQSYQLNAVLQIWLLGWAIPLSISTPHVTKDILGVVGFVEVFFAFILISTIIPRRDVLQEWCRQTDLRLRKGFARWWPDLIWDDRSPAVVALAINLGMATAVWMIFGFLQFSPSTVWPVAGPILLVLLNCGIAAQISASYQLPGFLNRSMVMIVFAVHVSLFSIIGSVVGDQFPDMKIFVALAIESTIVLLSIGLLWRRLQRMGRSETHKMFKTA